MSKPVLADLFSLRGRRNRRRYGLGLLALAAGSFLGLVILSMAEPADGKAPGALASAVVLLVWSGLAATWIALFLTSAQRFRDFGWTGLAAALLLVPVLGFFVLLALLVVRGSAAANRYGAAAPRRARPAPADSTAQRSVAAAGVNRIGPIAVDLAADIDARLLAEPVAFTVRLNTAISERTYRLDRHAILWEDAQTSTGQLPYAEVASVRLSYDPTRVARNRFQARVRARDGRVLRLSNIYFRGFFDIEERNAGYRHFIKALHAHLLAAGGDVDFRHGHAPWRVALNGAAVLFLLATLGLAGWLMSAAGLMGIVLVKLVFVAFYTPAMIRFMRLAAPGRYDPRAVPERLLPRASAGDRDASQGPA